MDNLTHSLFALTLARTSLGRAGRGTTTALLLASNAPDIDIVATAGGAQKYLEWHRGPTHGPIGVVGLSVATAGLAWCWQQWSARQRAGRSGDAHDAGTNAPPMASFAMLVAVSVVGIVGHLLMDLPTSYGTRVLSPFVWRWYAVDWMPIIDVYLLVILVSGILFRPKSEDARNRSAAIVLTLMATLYGVRAMAHRQAVDIAPRLFGPTLPQPCDPEPRQQGLVDSWPTPPASPPPPGRRCLVEIAALPTFTSPFDWRIVAHLSNAFEIHDINLLDSRFREAESESDVFWRQVLRYPNVWTPAIARAATTDLGQVFLGFSRFPAARMATDRNGLTTVRFTDVRFVGGPVRSDQIISRTPFFTASIRLDEQGRIVWQALGR